MAKFDSKVNGNSVAASEYNNLATGLKNLIENSGQTIDATNTQISKAAANYAAVSTYYTDSGSANAYVLSSIGNFESPDAYYDGMEIRFRAGNANTGASTVNVNGLGIKTIKKSDNSTDPLAGDVSTDKDVFARYDSSSGFFVLNQVVEHASETVKGVVELATQAEVNAGTDTSKVITPATLQGKSGQIIQVQESSTSTFSSTTSTIPFDNTIPQNTEGASTGVSITFTPISSTSTLHFFAQAPVDNNGGNTRILTLCNTTVSNCLAAEVQNPGNVGRVVTIPIIYSEASGSTSARTYELRHGGSAGTSFVNGNTSGAKFGGKMRTRLKILEIE